MWNQIFLSYLLLPISCEASSLATTLNAAIKDENLENLGIVGTRPDPFIAASPLIVAAVCSDGIALVAAHTVSSREKLLREVCREEADNDKADKDDGEVKAKTTFAGIWNDLPTDHGGPYRINSIDRSGTHLLSAGWRADCDLLIEKVRSIASNEVAVFGKPQWGLPYGRFLAQEASLWMAQLVVSNRAPVPTTQLCGSISYMFRTGTRIGFQRLLVVCRCDWGLQSQGTGHWGRKGRGQ